ncbi:Spt4/RpoE2 zinc finger [Trypanosoma melophagium]|uniref:Spt4/RpoE2 zinc finger n=1 Tax=Trypanosoma melophagium TaxID=715481 RepID=UPI00351AA49A|nr:Spt4/RpoE2 zinc finger [Trypanosoma melophagium]
MEEPPPPLPVGDRDYRACRRCRLVLTAPQFLREGCSVCGTAPPRREELNDATTADFTNFIGLIAPEKSWVARLIGRTNCPNGVFAAAINDEEDEEDEGEEEEDDERDETNEQQEGEGEGEEEEEEEEKMHQPPVMTDEELLAIKND